MKNEKIFIIASIIGKGWAWLFYLLGFVSGILTFTRDKDINSNNEFLSMAIIGNIIGILLLWFILWGFFSLIINLGKLVEDRNAGKISIGKYRLFWYSSLISTIIFSLLIIPVLTLIPQYICLYKSSKYLNNKLIL
jgi:Fe2+ transport system protein B